MGTLREYITRHHQSLNLSPTAATGISSLIISSNDINPHTSPSSLNWMEKYTIALDIADAMDYFHSAPMMQDNRGALHQNLKSSNVMLVSENGRIRAKVSDFGLSGNVEFVY